MSALDLAALKALHDAATCGVLTVKNHADYAEVSANGIHVAEFTFAEDAAFAAAAHTHWLELLAMAGASDTKDWGDKPLPEDAAIDAAHPLRSERHDLFQEALRMVGARRSKYGLVELVNWILNDLAAQKKMREEDYQEGVRLRLIEIDARKKAEADAKAAMAKRLEIATKALGEIDEQWRYDNYDAADEGAMSPAAKALAAIAAHEAERGKE